MLQKFRDPSTWLESDESCENTTILGRQSEGESSDQQCDDEVDGGRSDKDGEKDNDSESWFMVEVKLSGVSVCQLQCQVGHSGLHFTLLRIDWICLKP